MLREIAESGQSLAGFARSQGVSSWKLYKAKRKLRAKTTRPVDFDPVRITGHSITQSPIELDLSSGHRLRVPVGFDAGTLLRLIEVLGSC